MFGFFPADFRSLLVYESAVQKSKHCPTVRLLTTSAYLADTMLISPHYHDRRRRGVGKQSAVNGCGIGSSIRDKGGETDADGRTRKTEGGNCFNLKQNWITVSQAVGRRRRRPRFPRHMKSPMLTRQSCRKRGGEDRITPFS